jgi:hypothetical protein
MDRTGRISIVNVVFFLCFVAGAVVAYTFSPYYWDYLKMQEVTKSAVLEWDAWDSKPRAVTRLADELERREIPDYILDEDCEFIEEANQTYTVRCAWAVDVYYPFTDKFRTLSFETLETVEEGKLIR